MCDFRCGVSRATLWVVWLISTVIAAVYAALSLRTFSKVDEAYSDQDDANNQTVAVLVVAFAGPAVVIAFTATSLLLLIGKQVTTEGVGYYYGFFNASALNQSVVCILNGLVLLAFEDDLEDGFAKNRKEEAYSWSSTDSSVFKATISFAFIAAGTYFVLFLVMFLASFTIERQNTIMEEDEGKR